jgi:hypothetical protein
MRPAERPGFCWLGRHMLWFTGGQQVLLFHCSGSRSGRIESTK